MTFQVLTSASTLKIMEVSHNLKKNIEWSRLFFETAVMTSFFPRIKQSFSVNNIFGESVSYLFKYIALDVPPNCICEIHCIALDGFNLNTVHILSSKEKKSQPSHGSNSELLGGKLQCYLCVTQLTPKS